MKLSTIKTNLKLKMYSDAGHAWLAVKRKDIEALDLLKHISAFSYQKGGTLYLEEDRDAQLFLNKAKSLNVNVSIVDVNHGDRSPIRSYENFYGSVSDIL